MRFQGFLKVKTHAKRCAKDVLKSVRFLLDVWVLAYLFLNIYHLTVYFSANIESIRFLVKNSLLIYQIKPEIKI